MMESFQGWQAYVKWADSLKLRKKVAKEIYSAKKKRGKQVNVERYLNV